MGCGCGGVGVTKGGVEEDAEDWGDGEEGVLKATDVFDVVEEVLTRDTNHSVAQVLDDFVWWLGGAEVDEGNSIFVMGGGRVGNGGGSAPPVFRRYRGC